MNLSNQGDLVANPLNLSVRIRVFGIFVLKYNLAICPGLCIYLRNHHNFFGIWSAHMARGHATLFYKGLLPKIKMIFGDETVFTITFYSMLQSVSLSSRMFHRHPYWPYLLPHDNMAYVAIMPYYGKMAISHIALKQVIWPKWVSTEQAI